MKDLNIFRLSSKEVWISNGKRIFKRNKSQVVPQPDDTDTRSVSKLLKQLSPLNSNQVPQKLLKETLKPNDSRCEKSAFELSKVKGIVGRLDKKAFRVVFREERDASAKVIGSMIVITIKHKVTCKDFFKAMFGVQAHLDRENKLLVHAYTTVGQQAVKLLVSLAKIFGYLLWSEDMTLEYLQGAKRILRKVYVKRKPVFQFADQQLLQICRPLYSLEDAADYCHAKFLKHVKSDLMMQCTVFDLSFFKRIQSTFHGIIATHVDYTLRAGTDAFEKETCATAILFDDKPRQYNNLTFAGVSINRHKDGSRRCTNPNWEN